MKWYRSGLCAGWKRGACPCSRMATPGHLTCTYHRHQEELIVEMRRYDAASSGGEA